MVSPLPLRRYRADRLLREEFDALRGRVLRSVRGRLLAAGASLDQSDLEACYAHAWQGLYAATLAGEQIANPSGWLVLVTFRRAIEECRARRHLLVGTGPGLPGEGRSGERSEEGRAASGQLDLAEQLDDRVRLRSLLEALRGRLNAREREAATLCYLQGLSRAEAAARMGLSEARMRKLMEGRAPGRPGVAAKMGALVDTIREGGWCEEQGSLMRALAFGMLDPDGERYELATMHRRECPACRAYVLSLRGLAVVLPPPLHPLALLPGALAQAGARGGALGSAKGTAAAGALGSARGAASGASAGTLSATGAAGAGGAAGGAGGGWALVGGPLGAKLAVGCLLALGIGAGCAVLSAGGSRGAHSSGRTHLIRVRPAGGPYVPGAAGALAASPRALASVRANSAAGGQRVARGEVGRGASAEREFTPEQGAAGGASAAGAPAVTSAASSSSSARSSAPPASAASAPSSSAQPSAAEREFSP